MTKLEELKQAMDKAIEEFNIVHEEFRKKNDAQIQAKRAYEKELWKDKTCNNCMYSIVLDFSLLEDHNKCGCLDASCTCCNDHCEYYAPDNAITKALKEDPQLNKDRFSGFSLDRDEQIGLEQFGYNIYRPWRNREQEEAEQVIAIMKIKRGIKNENT